MYLTAPISLVSAPQLLLEGLADPFDRRGFCMFMHMGRAQRALTCRESCGWLLVYGARECGMLRLMGFLDGLSCGWISIGAPGTMPPGKPRTYVRYSGDQIPAVPGYLGSWDWLRASPAHPDSTLGRAQPRVARDLTPQALAELPISQALPSDFAGFVSDPGLRTRLRSATWCCFDLGHRLQPVPDGQLLHLISDSQWVMHWLLFLGDGGASAVVATRRPIGFDLDEAEEDAYWEQERWEYVRCAATFGEFIWRWWMDNEIFYRVKIDHQQPTRQQQTYIAAYGTPGEIEAI